MVYLTGDIHGFPWNLRRFCKKAQLTHEDTVVLLGDVGANYYGDSRDDEFKSALSDLNPSFLCIHGNHENRPENVGGYKSASEFGGHVWVEERYPRLFFARDGEIYNLGGYQAIAIGGAYSVDKYYRIAHGSKWWPDEQPSAETKKYVEAQIEKADVDIILSHTCPFKYIPREMFLSGIDQNTVDDSTERWLDSIEEKIKYKAWFCGHWHTDKRIDRMHFLFNSVELLEDEMRSVKNE